jgi:glycosyltransferase involved in cell wall biosynthesis
MEILYFGSLCNEELFMKNEDKEIPYFIAQYMYEKALCDELRTYDDINIEFTTIYQTEYFPKDKLFYIDKTQSHKNPYKCLDFINIPFLRELTYYLSATKKIIAWSIRHRKTKNKCIFTSVHFTPVSSAIVFISKLFGIKRIVTFTDLSLFTYSKERVNKMKFYKRILMGPYIRKTNHLQQSYNGYILFTKDMNPIVNPQNMPYRVVEGIFNNENLNMSVPEQRFNAIAHAGTLSHLVGIRNILDAFKKLALNTELWLIGGGDMSAEIMCEAAVDSRIKYFGYLAKAEVFDHIKRARLLVIFRNTNDEYTRYSFPSKLFEYMASGVPVLTTKLLGIPEEYYDYIYSVDSDNPDTLANTIAMVLSKSDDELHDIAQRARNFVLNYKNAKVQTEKVYSLIIDCINYKK